MEERAKLFKSGGSQALRLPRKYRFEGQREVRIHREGERVVLEPLRRRWSKRFLALAGSASGLTVPRDLGPPDPGPDLD